MNSGAMISTMNEKQYLRLKRQIEAEYHKKLEALEMVYQMARPISSLTGKQLGMRTSSKGALRNALRSAFTSMSGEFTPKVVLAKLRERDPAFAESVNKASLSSALARLAEGGEIELVEKGSGKRPSKYRVIGVRT
jgi:hypothetical protein